MNIRRRPPNPSVKVESLEYAVPHNESKARNILEKIVWEKDKEVNLAKKRISLDDIKSRINHLSKPKDFINALKSSEMRPAVIAEIKKASPSKGLIRADFDPVKIAMGYKKGGANCLSVLTDKTFFQGGFEVLSTVRSHVDLPILCKDFILSPYQIYQSRAAGADAVLLIAAILTDQDLLYLSKVAALVDLDVLVEVHDSKELARVLNLNKFKLIGINNRNLETFKTDISTTEELLDKFQSALKGNDLVVVSESGIFSNNDLKRVNSAGADAVLVGESLMRQEDVCDALIRLRSD
tara:strand:- start:747 stop:1631 length:885 start_codon:yes stop_codon:yes gene_type:complete